MLHVTVSVTCYILLSVTCGITHYHSEEREREANGYSGCQHLLPDPHAIPPTATASGGMDR